MRALGILLCGVLVSPARGQNPTPLSAAQVVQEVRAYRMDNEERIMRELREFLAIPNVASDGPNIQKNSARLVRCLSWRFTLPTPDSAISFLARAMSRSLKDTDCGLKAQCFGGIAFDLSRWFEQ